jgi:hypothetical protein
MMDRQRICSMYQMACEMKRRHAQVPPQSIGDYITQLVTTSSFGKQTSRFDMSKH